MTRVANNTFALQAVRHLGGTTSRQARSLERISSGVRINRAADDAAGLANSESLRAKLGGLRVARRNAQDGVAATQVAEGALGEAHQVLKRMRDLAVQSANTAGVAPSAVAAAQDEVVQLSAELDRIFDSTRFGDTALFDSGGTTELGFHVGTEASEAVTLSIGSSVVGADALGVQATAGGGSIELSIDASGAIDAIDAAIDTVSGLRGELGAFQNRLESTIRNLGSSIENLAAAESRIRDADIAFEAMSLTRNQVLQQAATSMVAQANSIPGQVLSLLG